MVKARKIISIMMMVMMILTVVSNVALAGNADPKKETGKPIDPINISPNTENTGKVQNIGEQIAGIVQVIGTIASVVMLIVLGVKYMMGSAEDKAEYKKSFMPYILGAILVFAASNLASMIYSWANQVTAGE